MPCLRISEDEAILLGLRLDFSLGEGARARTTRALLADGDSVGPIEKGPFYALKIVMGDLGSFDGLTTDVSGQMLNESGQPISGLYAVGNDRASMMGGNYPGAGITLGPIMTFGYIAGRKLAGVAD